MRQETQAADCPEQDSEGGNPPEEGRDDMPVTPLAAALAGGLILCASMASARASELITLDASRLEIARERIEAGDATLKPALDALVGRADAALKEAPDAVTKKGLTPPSGDKHDYMSLGPYWWPDPAKADGLPYIRKDGETNPASKNDDTDSRRIQHMCARTGELALAYYFTGKADYAAAAAEAIRTWFLAPGTRMNPNLRYGQAIPGIVDGRGIGIIDTRNLWMVIDAVALIEPSGTLSADEVGQLRQWFADFADWMVTSPQGHEESTWHNNHGTFYDVQLAGFALFAGKTDLAKQTVADAIHRRLAAQIAKGGEQYAELERTRPFHYSAFNLRAHLRLARYGEEVGVDYWGANQDGRTLKAGVDFLLSYLNDPKSWPYKDLNGVTPEEVLPVILQAARGWPQDAATYAAYLKAMPQSLASDEAYLTWPLK